MSANDTGSGGNINESRGDKYIHYGYASNNVCCANDDRLGLITNQQIRIAMHMM